MRAIGSRRGGLRAIRRVVAGAVATIAIATLAGCGRGRPPAAPAKPVDDVVTLAPESSALGLRRSVIADEYFWLRAKALEGEAPPSFVDALAAMRELRGDLSGDPTAWEDLEVPLGTVGRADELAEAYAALPATRDVGGRAVQLRARALRLAEAIGKADAAFRAGPFRAHDAEIAAAAKDLATRLLPKADIVLRTLEKDMGLASESRPITITLVGDAPYPGAFAADARGIATASFVRVHGLDGGALAETVIHEWLHALDELTVRLPTALNALRAALARRGFDESDANVEMAITTVTFAESASLVRRWVDPGHHPLGESGFYTLYPPALAIVDAWNRHIEGASLEETADRVAKAVAEPEAEDTPGGATTSNVPRARDR